MSTSVYTLCFNFDVFSRVKYFRCCERFFTSLHIDNDIRYLYRRGKSFMAFEAIIVSRAKAKLSKTKGRKGAFSCAQHVYHIPLQPPTPPPQLTCIEMNAIQCITEPSDTVCESDTKRLSKCDLNVFLFFSFFLFSKKFPQLNHMGTTECLFC